MKINIIGGGPAGLYFAILMKNIDPSHEITVVERDGPHDTFGWGIVFSDKTMDYLHHNDKATHDEIQSTFEVWDNVDIVYRSEHITIGGNRFSGIGRLAFLNIMQRRCDALGVDLRFNTNVEAVADWKDCDLLVGADGATSLVRETYAEQFGASLEHGKNTFVWLGTEQPFDALTLTLRQNAVGAFLAHSYRFNKTTSTFILECIGEAWKHAGFENMTTDEACRYLEDLFHADLHGNALLTNDFFRWRQFPIVNNQNWSFENVVLLGDALHTAHFSIGSGTKLALEDSIALATSMHAGGALPAALKAFREMREPSKQKVLQAAYESMVWIERMDERLGLEPIEFAYEMVTRSKRIDLEKLKQRAPEFVARYETWQQNQTD